MSAPTFDLLSTTASQLQEHLRNSTLNSDQIVTAYLDQIEAHNKKGAKLNAIIATPPRENVLQKAKELDDERAAGKLRGQFHGIPVIVKDCFTFEENMGMKTTVGSVVFSREKAEKNAAVIQQVGFLCNVAEAGPEPNLTVFQLIDQGFIILGTANLTVS
jgi:amidase